MIVANIISSLLTVSILLTAGYFAWQQGMVPNFVAKETVVPEKNTTERQNNSLQSNAVEVVLSVQDLREMREKMTNSERTKLFASVVRKLPPGEIEQLSNWLEAGLTADEVSQIKQMSNRYFTEAEIEQLMRYIEKSP
jgi:hypothetical protein